MKPKELRIDPYTAADADGVAASQTPAAGGVQSLTINGALASGGVATLDIPRQVAVTSAADDSGRLFVIVGTNSRGNRIVESIPGANAGASSTVKAFKTVIEVRVDGDTAGAVTVGTTTIVSTEWLPLDYLQPDFEVGLALNIPTGTGTPSFTAQLTKTNLLSYQGNNPVPRRNGSFGSEFDLRLDFIVPFAHDTLVTVTATGVTSGNIDFPTRAIRLTSNQVFTTNTVRLEVVQAHHGP